MPTASGASAVSTGVSAAHPARWVIQIAYSDMKPTNQSASRRMIQTTRPTVNLAEWQPFTDVAFAGMEAAQGERDSICGDGFALAWADGTSP